MPKIGDPVVRKEDLRLLTGRGNFSDDFSSSDQIYASLVRSPHAHAKLGEIDIRAALAMSSLTRRWMPQAACSTLQGATAAIQPGGSVRDAEVIEAADERGLAMAFTGTRHFRH